MDLEGLDALIEALKTWVGGVILISHDERFINAVCKQLFVCADGTLTKWLGDVSAYKVSNRICPLCKANNDGTPRVKRKLSADSLNGLFIFLPSPSTVLRRLVLLPPESDRGECQDASDVEARRCLMYLEASGDMLCTLIFPWKAASAMILRIRDLAGGGIPSA